MRILFWCELFWPHVGGVEILAAQTVAGLTARGFEVTVVTSQDDSLALDDVGDHAGAIVRRLPFRPALAARDVVAMMELRSRVHRLKQDLAPDLIHLFGLGPSTLFHLQTLNASPAPVMVTTHGEAFRGGGDRGETIFEKALDTATWVVGVSAAGLSATRDLCPTVEARSSVLYSGVAPLPAVVSPQPRSPTLLCLGRFVRDKGFDLAVAAFESVAREIPAARLILAGDGPLRCAVEERVTAAGLGERVELTGWVDDRQIARLLAAASLVLMPSRREGLPLVAIQAAQASVPVVATRVGGLPEVVVDGETGLVVPPEDPAALADAVLRLLHEPTAMQRMGAAARLRAAEVFGWARYLDDTVSLYGKLAGVSP